MKSCFVAQPFDRDKFDLRYTDVFEPAIRNAGLDPYRVDKDPGVKVPIEEIESRIKAAEIVFVDITLDNPNVWYELGYAFACQKDVVMVSYLSKAKTIESIAKTPVNDIKGLESHEIAILLIMMEKQVSPEDYVMVHTLKQDMDKAGYNPIATSVGLRTLAQKQMVETFGADNEYDQAVYPACRIIEAGDAWVIQNQHLITFRKTN